MSGSLLPKCAGIKLDRIISDQDSITIVVKSIASSALCPLCQIPPSVNKSVMRDRRKERDLICCVFRKKK